MVAPAPSRCSIRLSLCTPMRGQVVSCAKVSSTYHPDRVPRPNSHREPQIGASEAPLVRRSRMLPKDRSRDDTCVPGEVVTTRRARCSREPSEVEPFCGRGFAHARIDGGASAMGAGRAGCTWMPHRHCGTGLPWISRIPHDSGHLLTEKGRWWPVPGSLGRTGHRIGTASGPTPSPLRSPGSGSEGTGKVRGHLVTSHASAG